MANTPSSSPSGVKKDAGGGRTREQLLRLLESSAKKLKQFDKKYGEAKQQNELLQGKLREIENENEKLASKLSLAEADKGNTQQLGQDLEEKD